VTRVPTTALAPAATAVAMFAVFPVFESYTITIVLNAFMPRPRSSPCSLYISFSSFVWSGLGVG
jgi:hypothetical protein